MLKRTKFSPLLSGSQNGTEKTLEGSHVLVAAGRTPNTEGLGLELAGVELTDRGYIKVNERLQTTAPGVWAIGEVAGSPQFTHISVDDFRVVHDNLIGVDHATTGRQVPYCLFTDPELARVGLSEHEATARGLPYRSFKVPMEAVLPARTLSETRGFLKALVEADGDRILGFTAFGVGAAEMMSAVQIAMVAGLPYTRCATLSDASHISRGADTAVLIRGIGAQRCRCDTNQERGDEVKREERKYNDVEEMGGRSTRRHPEHGIDGVLGLRGTSSGFSGGSPYSTAVRPPSTASWRREWAGTIRRPKDNGLPISSAVTGRPAGAWAANCSSPSPMASVPSVRVGPGLTALTRTPLGPYSAAHAWSAD